MNVVLYGATGNSGSRILSELVNRGHHVTGVARDVSGLPATIDSIQDDLSEVGNIASIIADADVVVSAYNPPPATTDDLVEVAGRQIAAVKKTGDARLIVVGGCGVLEVAPGVALVDSGHLPEAYVSLARSHAKTLELLRSSDVNWTYLSPGVFFEPGERTGKFRLSQKDLVSDANGESRISCEDYAIALVDEIEVPHNERRSFAVAY